MNLIVPHYTMDSYILIAEDDEYLVNTYREILESHGQKIISASNGLEAIKIIDQNQPSLLMLDLSMPALDGLGVLKHIVKKGYKFPTIVLTNLVGAVDEEEQKKAGVVEYVVKSTITDESIWPLVEKYTRK